MSYIDRDFLEESLLVLRTLGIKTRTSSASYLLPSTVRFIPTTQIRDIFIHEAFKGFEVRYYLAVVVEGEGELVVVFPVSNLAAYLTGLGGADSTVSVEATARKSNSGRGMEGCKTVLV